MQTAIEHIPAESRRPGALDFAAALLLLGTIVLHVVAMMPTYFGGSLTSQPDQAALYSVLAASWALALAIGLTGPHRMPVAAALATGVAVAELGFRVADLGDALKYGTDTAGAGLWLMESAWVVGAAGAVVALLAARSRHSNRTGPEAAGAGDWQVDWAEPAREAPVDDVRVNPYSDAMPSPADEAVLESPVSNGAGPAPAEASFSVVPDAEEDPHERLAWTLLVVVLAAVVAGAFLPAWDHAVAVSTQSGQTVTRSLGNAFNGPWQQVLGIALAAAALLVVPAVAVRMRDKAAGAAAAVGALLVLASQLVSAVVQVDEPVPAADFGIGSAQAHSLGLSLSLKLTGWFTLEALAAYALFAAVMVWATLRTVQENSAGTVPSAPERRSAAMPSAL